MAEKNKKKSSYISGKESRKITRFNRRVTKKLEKERADAGRDPALYTVQMKDPNNVVEFDNVCTYFFTDVGTVKAVDGVNFNIPKHSTVGVVGESGCGKSVTSLSLMQLLARPSGQTVGGQIRFNMGDGTAINIVNTPNAVMEKIRGNKISMIFQEPMTSLNPVFRIGEQVDEVTKLHNPEMSDEDVKARTLEMLELVGIANKEGVYNMYPHELSGAHNGAGRDNPGADSGSASESEGQTEFFHHADYARPGRRGGHGGLRGGHVCRPRGREGNGGGDFPSSDASVYDRPDEVQAGGREKGG